MLRRALIAYNHQKPAAHALAVRLTEEFLSRSVCVLAPENGPLPGAQPFCAGGEAPQIAVVLGGDGTLLQAAGSLLPLGAPVLGVNLGHLGFLTECEPDKLLGHIDQLVQMDFAVEERATLRVTSPVLPGEQLAINDLCLHRADYPGILRISLSINGQMLEKFNADGLLISTPTGSTAYNLSAGGPLLLPTVRSFAITPVCAHTPILRPIVVGDGDVVRFSASWEDSGQGGTPALTMDGRLALHVPMDVPFEAQLSCVPFRLIKLDDTSFFRILNRKLYQSGYRD